MRETKKYWKKATMRYCLKVKVKPMKRLKMREIKKSRSRVIQMQMETKKYWLSEIQKVREMKIHCLK